MTPKGKNITPPMGKGPYLDWSKENLQVARGYPGNSRALKIREFDFRDYLNAKGKPVRPPRAPGERPFLSKRSEPRLFGKRDREAERHERFKQAVGNAVGLGLSIAIERLLPAPSLAFDLAETADDMIGAKNPFYIKHPDFTKIPNGAKRWKLWHGPNIPRSRFYGGAYVDGICWSTNAYIVGSVPGGPGTGVIAGQSIATQFDMQSPPVIASVNPYQTHRMGIWYWANSVHRGAQLIGFYAPTGQLHAYQHPAEMLDAFGFRQAPMSWGPSLARPDLDTTGLVSRLGDVLAPGNIPIPSYPLTPAINGLTDPFAYPGHIDEGQPATEPQAQPIGDTYWPPVRPTDPGGHTSEPPPKGTKERKARAKGIAGTLSKLHKSIGDIVGGFSEFGDVIDAAHDALPKEYKAKSWYKGERIPPGWQKKWNAVYQHWDKVNVVDFIANLAKNNLQDLVIGKINQGANKGLLPKPPGVGLDRFKALGDMPMP